MSLFNHHRTAACHLNSRPPTSTITPLNTHPDHHHRTLTHLTSNLRATTAVPPNPSPICQIWWHGGTDRHHLVVIGWWRQGCGGRGGAGGWWAGGDDGLVGKVSGVVLSGGWPHFLYEPKVVASFAHEQIYKSQRNVVLCTLSCLLYWCIYRVCKYNKDIQNLEEVEKRYKKL
ncbi:hypothetical protein KSS87_005146 [Heliosperma pusillum]|nr:hypothetical protein KSS87_005146 [Heliosperma pusillum]